MAGLLSYQFSQKNNIFLILNFDQVYDRLHGIISTCISDSLAFNVFVPFNFVLNIMYTTQRSGQTDGAIKRTVIILNSILHLK